MYTVVIIEDEAFMRRAIAQQLVSSALNLTLAGEASNGEEGLKLLTEVKPDLALVDIDMPKMNGLDMIGRAQEKGCRTRFILMTGYDDFSYAQKAVKLSVDDYLLKPVNPQALFETVLRVESVISRQAEIDRHITDLERKNVELMCSDFLSALISGVSTFGRDIPKNLFEEMKLPETLFQSYVFVCVNPDSTFVAAKDFNSEIEKLSQTYPVFSFHPAQGGVCLLCAAKTKAEADPVLMRLQELGLEHGASQVHAGTGEIGKAYLQAHANLHTAQIASGTKISDTVKRYIEEHLQDPELSIGSIAKDIFINYSYICYCFKRDCDTTVNDYITMRRIDEAKRMFRSGIGNINLVSQKVGYNSNSYFSKSFKKIVGVSPSQFVAQYQENRH